MPPVPSYFQRSSAFETRAERYLARRAWPIAASATFVLCGLLYVFRWSPVVRHRPSLWIMPSDLWVAFGASSASVHGHLASIYGSGFLAFPGFLLLLAPVAALSGRFSTTFVQVTNHGHTITGAAVYTEPGTPTILYDALVHAGNLYAVHQGVFFLLMTYVLLLSCTALFAFDALAEELGVGRGRRAVLSIAEGVLLWVVVMGGHPEDVLSVALATWALLWAFRGRWVGAGWLFGAALAVQPLVVVMFPLLLALGGRHRALGMVVRAVVPAAVVLAGPLVADAHDTVHTLIDQPTFPNLPTTYRTLWTPLAPRLGGRDRGRPWVAAPYGWWPRARPPASVGGRCGGTIATSSSYGRPRWRWPYVCTRSRSWSPTTRGRRWRWVWSWPLGRARADRRRLDCGNGALVIGQWRIDDYVGGRSRSWPSPSSWRRRAAAARARLSSPPAGPEGGTPPRPISL